MLLGDQILGLGKVLALYPAHGLGTRLGRCRDETNLYVPLICLFNHLQFVYHVTCSAITVKPGTDTIHSVRTTTTQVHFVCVLSVLLWVTTVHLVYP